MQYPTWSRIGVLAASVLACAVFGCADETETTAGGELGAECNPADASSCNEGLTCTAIEGGGATCTFPVGGDCDPEADNGGCPANAECVAPSEGEPEKCLIKKGEECDPAKELCAPDLVCAEVSDGGNRCFEPVTLRGHVSDTSSGEGISGAHVIALDAERVAVTDVAVSDADGNYTLQVPVVRGEDGKPADETFTLSAAAADHQPFPSGIRVALPITASEAELDEGEWALDNALTQIGLIPLEAGDRYSISGKLVAAGGDDGDSSHWGGVLVVASGDNGAFSALTDRSGAFTIFNVVDGSYEVRGYAAELQLQPESVTVDGAALDDVELEELEEATTTVNGTIQIVNAAGGAVTSVILVVKDTFDENAARGEAPRGLRAPRSGEPNVDGAWTIEGVPDGTYVVLAAYENDGLVRDPDTNIAGTTFVTLDVKASENTTLDVSESFKVTEALAVFGPGVDGAEAVTDKPELRWADDSSEDYYEVRVFDAFGNEVWSVLDLPGASGSDEVSVAYAGPLEVGMYYQFRVSSWRQPGNGDPAPISTTEDLRGVFFKSAE